MQYKKYFYVLRPLLACKWNEKKADPPPVRFRDLVKEALEDDMRPAVEDLLRKKMQMAEQEKGRRVDSVNEYIVRELAHFKETADSMEDDRNGDWDALNRLFMDCIGFDRAFYQNV